MRKLFALIPLVIAVVLAGCGGGGGTPTYTVAYDGNGNTGGSVPTDGTLYEQGQTVTVRGPGSLAKDGCAFTGWNTEANGSGTTYRPDDTFPMPAADVSLYARWTAAGSANVLVYLAKRANGAPCYVDKMTVSIQKAGGPVLTGVTNYQGIATIAVTETGVYQVIKVQGVDASSLGVNGQGREFAKDAPLQDPYPNLVYSFPNPPAVNVTYLGRNYLVGAAVPGILKVTVLETGHVAAAPGATVAAGTGPFLGRVMLTNIDCSDDQAMISIVSSLFIDNNHNAMILYPNKSGWSPEIRGASFYSGSSEIGLGDVSGYTREGPIYFEAPGNGDWALGCAGLSGTILKNRDALGGAGLARDFSSFDGGAVKSVIRAFSYGSPNGGTCNFDYRIFKFEPLS